MIKSKFFVSFSLVILVLLFLKGCSTDNSKMDTLLMEIKQINERLDNIEKKLGKSDERVIFKQKGPDYDALDNIKYPENPTKESLVKYIREIISVSSDQTTLSPDDPQVDLLTKVGEDNIDLLINIANVDPRGQYHASMAIIKLATDKSKDKIINALEHNHDLIEIIVRNGWEADVKDILVNELTKTSLYFDYKYLPNKWISAVASFQDPTTYDALIYFFVNGANKYSTYKIIKDLPGIELDDHITEAWNNAKLDNEWQKVPMAIVAVKYGHKDALETLINNINSKEYDYYYRMMRSAITKHSDAKGSNEAIITWYESNKDYLVFNVESKKFVVKK